MRVYIPSPLRSYTDKQSVVEAEGGSIAELLSDLEGRYPGIRFRIVDEQDRIREHFKFFVNQSVADTLTARIGEHDEVRIIAAISGG